MSTRTKAAIVGMTLGLGLAGYGCTPEARSEGRQNASEQVEPARQLPGTRAIERSRDAVDAVNARPSPDDLLREEESSNRPGRDASRDAVDSSPVSAVPVEVEIAQRPETIERRPAAPPLEASDREPGQVPTDSPVAEFPEAEGDPAAALDPEPERAPAPPVPYVERGTEFELRMETEINTGDNLVGDVFYASVTDDVLAADGMVLIPLGTMVRGRVVESRPSPSDEEDARLAVAFETMILGGVDIPIEASVLGMPVEVGRRDSSRESAAKVAGGAAAGAILGKILGRDNKDAVKGAVVGAAAGAAVAYGTRDGHARVLEGALVRIRLDRDIRLIVT